eukprot:TRINITY_DN7981_c0_g1_i1.p1 TRINITY_DN7981_c0_g1~~TRINITY_DN7981_c0_g1_i1.p1  ORF type:complete len:228 (+),score=38.11 TRINITY_DN7981_c0_g1_i1:3-686(+)
MRSAFPEVDWSGAPERMPNKYWKDLANQKAFLDQAAQSLNVKQNEDWYRVRRADILRLGGHRLLNIYGNSLLRALAANYPEYEWTKTSQAKTKSQHRVFELVKEIFPHVEDVFFGYFYRVISNGQPIEKSGVQLDVYIPSLALAFEYQGEYHYQKLARFGNAEQKRALDSQKNDICRDAGITLIEVPYWWDHSKNSLTATIQASRPDLISSVPPDQIPIPRVKSGLL